MFHGKTPPILLLELETAFDGKGRGGWVNVDEGMDEWKGTEDNIRIQCEISSSMFRGGKKYRRHLISSWCFEC